MFKKIGILSLLMLCFIINVDAQKNSKDAQRKAKLKEMERQRKEAERAKKGKKNKKEKGTKEITKDDLEEANTKPAWLERIVIGGGLGAGYSNGWNFNVTPTVYYKITDRFWAGPGLDFYYASYKFPGTSVKQKYSVLGPKAAALYYITPEINLGTEYAFYSFTITETVNNRKSKFKADSDSWLVGGGYTQRMGARGGVRLELYYDVLYNDSDAINFRSSAFVPRLNVFYGL